MASRSFAKAPYGRMASRFFGKARSEHPVAGSGSGRGAACARARSAIPTPIPLPGRFLAAAQLRPLSGRGGIRFGLRYGSLTLGWLRGCRDMMASRFSVGLAEARMASRLPGYDGFAVFGRAR